MADKPEHSRMQASKTDAYIQDYLSDILGENAAPVRQSAPEVAPINSNASPLDAKSPDLIHKTSLMTQDVKGVNHTVVFDPFCSVKPGFTLIPTIKVNSSSDTIPTKKTQTELVVVLLTNLYFLRRFLPAKVRSFVLTLSEQVIDDYQANLWLASIQEGN